ANVSRLPYNYTLAAVQYTGDATVLGMNASYPIHRSNDSNVSLSAGFDHKNFRNSVQGIEINNKRVSVGMLTLSGDALDGVFGGGLTQYSFGVSNGRLDLGGNAADLASDQVANGPARQGSFGKFSWSLSRLQRLAAADTLAVLASGQVANANLDSSERFLATGPYAVRAYSSSEPSGDDGSILTVEWRHQLRETLSTAVFFDTARISRDHTPNIATQSPNGMSFSGAGLGVNYGKASDLAVRASVAWRIGNNPAANPVTGLDADGTHRDPRFWLTALKVF
ncbi:MAG: ShlB/FhaC/HecB family hemolysin secretion/activation protein, partial [Zoogloea sp.]|nr:ShlB/FhaC/HecB family hemolysin secretion/activation protein [Zoogloea sp.]